MRYYLTVGVAFVSASAFLFPGLKQLLDAWVMRNRAGIMEHEARAREHEASAREREASAREREARAEREQIELKKIKSEVV